MTISTTTTTTILKAICVSANSNPKNESERHAKRNAISFLKNLGKEDKLLEIIERPRTTPRDVERREEAMAKYASVRRARQLDAFIYGLPNTFDEIDDALFELFGKHAAEVAAML